MDRRSYSKRVGVLGSITLLPVFSGCSGFAGGLEVTGVEADSTNLGNVVMAVRVRNESEEPTSGLLVGQVDIEEGDTYTESREITVPGQDYNDYRLEFDIGLSESLSGSSYTYDAWIES